MALMVLGAVSPLLVSGYTGFDLDQTKQRIRILSDGMTLIENEVIQQGAAPRRAASASFVAETAEAETIRGYYEDGTAVTFEDDDGVPRSVMVFDFSRSQVMSGLWSVSVVLLEIEAGGS